ncbi:MAG: hypothetical protein Q9171_003349 [Xanthocarpia ochracea]
MGTRGYKAWRLRKRYYFQYNHWDSYPEGLGKDIAKTIPTDPEEYAAWLEAQRKMVTEWEAMWMKYLTLKHDGEQSAELPKFMWDYQPSFLAPLNDVYIEWVYIIDLDREIFSVSNGAHFKLDRIPHIDWIGALNVGSLGDQICLPALLPEGACTNVVAEPSTILPDLVTTDGEPSEATSEYVTPKSVKDIPWRRRHGPSFHSLMFYLWSIGMKDGLAATLLQWTQKDLPFREIAFAALCFASGGDYLTFHKDTEIQRNEVADRVKPDSQFADAKQTFSWLATGARPEGSSPSSVPEDDVYWMDGVLVVLTTQLFRPRLYGQSIERVVKYCDLHYHDECVDAVIMSIEHVILVHVVPGAKVQCSNLLALFDIPHHLTLDVRERYAGAYLEKLAGKDEAFMKKEKKKITKAMDEMALRNEGIAIHRGGESDEEDDAQEEEAESALYTTQALGEDNTLSTFYALTHFFDAAARRRMPPMKARDGRFPNEIYENILSHVVDRETRISCMHVSRFFRQLCQENYLFADGVMFGPSKPVERCLAPKLFEMYVTDTGSLQKVKFQRAGGFLDSLEPSWVVAVGTSQKMKILLPNLKFRLPEATNLEEDKNKEPQLEVDSGADS